MIAKEVSSANLAFCCLQEVRYRNMGKKLIKLDTGESFAFWWCGMKKRRDAGVGILVKVDNDIIADDPDINEPRLMALNMKVHGFNVTLVNGYAPTDSDGSEYQKNTFYRSLRKACERE